MSCDGKCSVALPHSAVCLQSVIVVFPDHTLSFFFHSVCINDKTSLDCV